MQYKSVGKSTTYVYPVSNTQFSYSYQHHSVNIESIQLKASYYFRNSMVPTKFPTFNPVKRHTKNYIIPTNSPTLFPSQLPTQTPTNQAPVIVATISPTLQTLPIYSFVVKLGWYSSYISTNSSKQLAAACAFSMGIPVENVGFESISPLTRHVFIASIDTSERVIADATPNYYATFVCNDQALNFAYRFDTLTSMLQSSISSGTFCLQLSGSLRNLQFVYMGSSIRTVLYPSGSGPTQSPVKSIESLRDGGMVGIIIVCIIFACGIAGTATVLHCHSRRHGIDDTATPPLHFELQVTNDDDIELSHQQQRL